MSLFYCREETSVIFKITKCESANNQWELRSLLSEKYASKPSREPRESIAADPGIPKGVAPTRRGQRINLPDFPNNCIKNEVKWTERSLKLYYVDPPLNDWNSGKSLTRTKEYVCLGTIKTVSAVSNLDGWEVFLVDLELKSQILHEKFELGSSNLDGGWGYYWWSLTQSPSMKSFISVGGGGNSLFKIKDF